MKLLNIIGACISILYISQYIYAQQTDPNSFFPYSVGNIWEYDQGWYSHEEKEKMSSIENIKKFLKPNEIVRYEILRDSVGLDGHIYLFYGSIFDPLWSIDTSSSIVYYNPKRLNWQYYLLEADTGYSWMVAYEDSSAGSNGRRALVKNKYSSVIFGMPTEFIEIEYYELNWGDTVINQYSIKRNTETLASGFGLILNFFEEPGSFNSHITGCVIDGDTFGIITAIKEDIQIPLKFYLSQNYPNPFNPITKIKFKIPTSSVVTLKIYDVLGREVKTLINEYKTAGGYEIEFDGSKYASGIYFYRLTSGEFTSVRKLIFLK